MATWSGAWSMVRVQLDTLSNGQRWASPHVTCCLWAPSVGILRLVTWSSTNCQTGRWAFLLLSPVVFGVLLLQVAGTGTRSPSLSKSFLCLCHLLLWVPFLHLATVTVTRANIRSLELVASIPRLATWSGTFVKGGFPAVSWGFPFCGQLFLRFFDIFGYGHHDILCGQRDRQVCAENILGCHDGLFVGHFTFPLAPIQVHWPRW